MRAASAVHPWADVVMPEVVQETGRMAPAGQLWSTVEDLCRFANLLANGADGVLSADTVAEMREPRSAPEVDELGIELRAWRPAASGRRSGCWPGTPARCPGSCARCG